MSAPRVAPVAAFTIITGRSISEDGSTAMVVGADAEGDPVTMTIPVSRLRILRDAIDMLARASASVQRAGLVLKPKNIGLASSPDHPQDVLMVLDSGTPDEIIVGIPVKHAIAFAEQLKTTTIGIVQAQKGRPKSNIVLPPGRL